MTGKNEDFGRSIDALFKDVVDTLTKTILVVDDSMTMRRIIARALSNIGSFTLLGRATASRGSRSCGPPTCRSSSPTGTCRR
jgi:hypothetical protein